ncbi:uncharacterized protein LOC131218293 [Magnolia sinica]|uniref:uncharacterized protein LOC131218293 n=1 Tax=Magnolia sinica TaxID=86752 RepID=UPI002659B29A|nr:uncharacterized protein LOC131218293 [Magnolia sinica]
MDVPILEVGHDQKTLDSMMEGGPVFHCDLCDSELVNKIVLLLLTGLSSACVDNTTGDLFKSPALVAVDMRKEMVDYLIQRSETHVAETVIEEDNPDTETSDHPTDIIEDFLDDFTSLKRNMLSRVSGWLLSERREDKIDDFVQEMEINGFWLMDRRASVAQTLLRNVDFKNEFHCEMKFDTIEELSEHKSQCIFRSLNCTNEGCNARFCAVHKEKHEGICPFKVLPCEQKCSAMIVRHEMDRHCITICTMKLVNCPFYPVGCQSAFPVCTIEQHCSEFLRSHVMHILHVIHKQVASEDNLKQHMEALEKSPSFSKLSKARDPRSLTLAVKEQEAKIEKKAEDDGVDS